LSIGGWLGSLYYSANVGTPENRTAFVNAVINVAQKYQLDGIDFEYVIVCVNNFRSDSEEDSAHFLAGSTQEHKV
jgi:chitinase